MRPRCDRRRARALAGLALALPLGAAACGVYAPPSRPPPAGPEAAAPAEPGQPAGDSTEERDERR